MRFRGHLVFIGDEFTASDGEAFAEGFPKELGHGQSNRCKKLGREVWLSGSNTLLTRHPPEPPMNGGFYGENWVSGEH